MNYSTLSIIIPVYNEEKTIQKILNRIEKVDIGNIKREIIIVNDASTDKTNEILKQLENKYKIITHSKNQGKSAAVKTGILASTGDLLIIQDADLEYDPDEYHLLIEPFEKGNADVVYGSRFRSGRPHRTIYYRNQIANQFLTMLSNIFTSYNLSDVETGFKMFRGDLIRKMAPRLEAKRFGFEVEITAYLAKTKAKVYEVGISYYGRTVEEGKHITLKDGLLAIWEIIKYNVLKK